MKTMKPKEVVRFILIVVLVLIIGTLAINLVSCI